VDGLLRGGGSRGGGGGGLGVKVHRVDVFGEARSVGHGRGEDDDVDIFVLEST
jgi:hypothetical protein